MKAVAAAAGLGVALAATAAATAAPYRWPLDAGTVTAYYDHGNTTDWRCQSHTYSGHKGTDIGVPRQTQVYAAQDGWVKHRTDGYGDGYIGSTDGGGFGNVCALFHGNGEETIYGHMSAGSGIPALGATETCGAMIGRSGTSGNSSGPHLHFETRVGVSETGSYYSGAADDPYAGPCGGPTSFWRDQNGGAPTTSCGGPPPPVDDAAFVADLTIPDGTEVVTGTVFVKTWRLRNSGSTTWGDGYTLVHVDGPDFAAAPVAVSAGPGEEIDVAVVMTASGEGAQRSSWQVAHDGTGFGQVIWADVVVVASPSSDGDGDGFGPGQDCDDGDATVYPGAVEACDGRDGDCDGIGDDGLVRTCCDTGTATCGAGGWSACTVTCDEHGADDVSGGCDAGGGGGAPPAGPLAAAALVALAAVVRRARGRSGWRSA